MEADLKEQITYSVTAVVGGFDVKITLPSDWCNGLVVGSWCSDLEGEFYLKLGTERFPSSGTVKIKAGKSGTIRVTKEGTYTLMESELWPKPDVDLGTLYVDFTKPTSSITSPSAGSWQKSDFSVSISDSDKGSGLDKCEYKVISSGTTTKDWTSRTCSTSITITVGSSKDCRHEGSNKCTVYARAKDKAGNLGDSVSRNFGIDWTAPSAPSVSSSSHPSQMVWYSNNDPSFSWTAPSDTSGIAGYSYTLDQSSTTTPDTTMEPAGTSASYSNKADGTWYFHIRAKDNAGNWGSTAHYTAKIDTTGPETTISLSGTLGELGWYKSNVQVSLSASDSHSGVASTKYCVDTSNTCTPTTSYSSAFTVSTEGTSYVRYRSTDNAGNTEATKSTTVKIDKTAPSAPSVSSSSHPSQMVWYSNNDPSFSWTAPSDTSGIAGYSYTLDQSSTTTPDTTMEPAGTSASYSNKADGTWYFHIRAKDNAGNWGSTAHYTAKIDETPGMYESYLVSGCNYQDAANNVCWVKAGTATQHEIRHYDATSTPRTQYLTFTKDGCTPNGCSSGEEIKSYVNVDTGAFTDWMANNNYIDITGAICVETGGCTGTYAKERWTVTTGSSGGNFKVWTFLYDEAGNGRGYDYVGWWYKVDVTSPSSAITSPAAGSTQTSDFPVSVSDSDGGSGLDTTKCEYRVVSSGTETKPWTTRTCSSPFTVTVGTGKDCRHDGTNTCTVYVRAWDKVGNVGTGSRSFSITTALPDLAISEADITFEKAGGG